jgi:hypothetical protein
MNAFSFLFSVLVPRRFRTEGRPLRPALRRKLLRGIHDRLKNQTPPSYLGLKEVAQRCWQDL